MPQVLGETVSPFRSRVVLTTGIALSIVGLVIADTSVATSPDTSVATSAETSVGTASETAAIEILPPDESWGGLTRGEWDARAWQWSVSQPVDIDASLAVTKDSCGYGQSGPVFFLLGSQQTCVVAEGTAILVKVAGVECSTLEPEPYFGRDDAELRACATAALSDEVADLQARVNGQEVADLESYLTESPMFTLTWPENNRFGIEPGVAQSVSAAYNFIIAPPPPGEYEIFTSVAINGETFANTVTVIVEAPRVVGVTPSTGTPDSVTDTSDVAIGTGSSQRLAPRPAGTTDAPLGYYEYLPPDYDGDESSPLLVFLHGYGESGDGSELELGILRATGIPQLIETDRWPSERPFVVLAPQHAYPQEEEHFAPCDGVLHFGSCAMRIQHDLRHPENGSICLTPTEIHDFLTYAIANYDVDPDRVYLTGLSCGAFGAWEYVAEYGGDQIAAIVPIAGDGRPAWDAAMCSLGEVGIWAFHGDLDDVVAPAGSIDTIDELTACPQPRLDAELTVYPDADHDSWTRTYDESAGHDIYDWLLGFTVS